MLSNIFTVAIRLCAGIIVGFFLNTIIMISIDAANLGITNTQAYFVSLFSIVSASIVSIMLPANHPFLVSRFGQWLSKALNFVLRILMAFGAGFVANIVLSRLTAVSSAYLWLFGLISVDNEAYLEIFTVIISLSTYAIITALVFSLPIRPLFEPNASRFVRIAIILFGAAITMGMQVLLWYEWSPAAVDQERYTEQTEIERKKAYLQDNKEALLKLYGDGCFMLTPKNSTYALDPKFAAMDKGTRVSAFMDIERGGNQAYCTDDLKYY